MVGDNFDIESEEKLHNNCSIVYVLPTEYDRVSEVYEAKEDSVQDKVINQKPFCYCVINNNVVEEQQAIFERSDPGMIYHLKPLFTRAKVYDISVNKVFFDGSEAVNLMSHSVLKKMGKTDEDL